MLPQLIRDYLVFHCKAKYFSRNIFNGLCKYLSNEIHTTVLSNKMHMKCEISPKAMTPRVLPYSNIYAMDYFVSRQCTVLPKRTLRRLNEFWCRPKKKHGNYDIVEIGEVTPPRSVLGHIKKPDYALTGVTDEHLVEIEQKDEDQIKRMRESCALARTVLDEVAKHIQVGRTTDELDSVVHETCISFGAYPSPLNYRGFPKSVCTSVNNVACHGIPDDRQLKNGDIISIDVSVYYNGYHGDCAASYSVGDVDEKGQKLMSVAYQCLNEAVGICYPGQSLCQVGKTISNIVSDHGFTVVPAFCGHGIGTYFHGPPNIYHFDNNHAGVMVEGMTFTIEPVISEGGPDIVVLEDGWTAVTLDNSRCAQYEHTVLITETGVEVLTLPNPQTTGSK